MACAIHCMITPILVILMPMAGMYLEKYHWIEYVIILSVIVLGSVSLYTHSTVCIWSFFYDIRICFTYLFSERFNSSSFINWIWWYFLRHCSVSEFASREKLE
jgi:hypothetical protein